MDLDDDETEPADNRLERPPLTRGAPHYACPKVPVENVRLSKPNRSSVKPAGIREGDYVLPYKFERRDQTRFAVNGKVLRTDQLNPKVMHARANTGDQFVVTGKPVSSVMFNTNISFPIRAPALFERNWLQLYEIPPQETVPAVRQEDLRWCSLRPRQGPGEPL